MISSQTGCVLGQNALYATDLSKSHYSKFKNGLQVLVLMWTKGL